MKASKNLIESAWEYVLRHNREFPDDPRFVNDSECGPLIDAMPHCISDGGLVIHKGHGLGEPCKKFMVETTR